MPAKLRSEGRRFDELATALGYVSIQWGRLEVSLSEFIEILAPLEEGDVSRSVTSGMDVRTKIQVIKALSFIRKPYKEWFDKMALLLDYVDNNLRPRRNRVTHDAFFRPKGRIIRRMHQIKFEKPQSFQLILRTVSNIPVTLPEIRQLANEIDDLFFICFAFFYDYMYPDVYRALPSRRWKQFIRRAKPDAPRTYVDSMRQHPLRSSRGKARPQRNS